MLITQTTRVYMYETANSFHRVLREHNVGILTELSNVNRLDATLGLHEPYRLYQ